jgi:hypothetical protein
MKKIIISVVALALGIGLLLGVPALAKGPRVKPVSTGTGFGQIYLRMQPLPKDENGHAYYPLKDYRNFIEEHAKGVEAGQLDVPVYYEAELIPFNECFSITYNSDLNTYINTRSDTFRQIAAMYPTKAIRKGVDGQNIYIMYDTDTGYRVYCFFSYEKTQYRDKDGFTIFIRKGQNLSYGNFENIQVGSEISDVQRIDPNIAYSWDAFDTWNEAVMENSIKMGMPPTTIHYLKDGILKIEYMRISGRYFVTRMVYSMDYTLDGLFGSTCYKIADIDNVSAK